MAKVLIVDDDGEELMQPVISFYTRAGHEVSFCYNVREAIEAINKGTFDAVITDRQMHRDDDAGFKVAEAAAKRGITKIAMQSGGVTAANTPLVEGRLRAIEKNALFFHKGEITTPMAIHKFINTPQQSPSAYL